MKRKSIRITKGSVHQLWPGSSLTTHTEYGLSTLRPIQHQLRDPVKVKTSSGAQLLSQPSRESLLSAWKEIFPGCAPEICGPEKQSDPLMPQLLGLFATQTPSLSYPESGSVDSKSKTALCIVRKPTATKAPTKRRTTK